MSTPGTARSVAKVAKPRVIDEPRNLTLDIFKALADPVRLELIAHIAACGPICVCHLEEALPYRQPRISRHLGVLRRAGLVSSRREGNWVYYSTNTEALEAAQEYLEELRATMRVPHLADTCES
jgi:ArsR family transcriptional regulator, arsenate/arsenite/antimonite-responsive transcriptional repressor